MQPPYRPMDEEQKQASQPLYEFITDEATPGVPPGESAQQEADAVAHAHQPSEEEIRQGLVYPPPPSFYQNMQEPAVPPPLPPGMYRPIPVRGNAVQDRQPAAGAYPPPFAPPHAPAAPPVKRSRTWIWLVVSILCAALLVSCGLCGWALYSGFSSTFQQVMAPVNVADNYYSALQAKNYGLAYSYLAPQGSIQGLTLDQYTQQARNRDSQYGPVLSYNVGQPAIDNSTSFSRTAITVDVSRTRQKYNVLLTLQKIGGQWKIVDYDRI